MSQTKSFRIVVQDVSNNKLKSKFDSFIISDEIKLNVEKNNKDGSRSIDVLKALYTDPVPSGLLVFFISETFKWSITKLNKVYREKREPVKGIIKFKNDIEVSIPSNLKDKELKKLLKKIMKFGEIDTILYQ